MSLCWLLIIGPVCVSVNLRACMHCEHAYFTPTAMIHCPDFLPPAPPQCFSSEYKCRLSVSLRRRVSPCLLLLTSHTKCSRQVWKHYDNCNSLCLSDCGPHLSIYVRLFIYFCTLVERDGGKITKTLDLLQQWNEPY